MRITLLQCYMVFLHVLKAPEKPETEPCAFNPDGEEKRRESHQVDHLRGEQVSRWSTQVAR